jgi:hypothetical protein
LRFWVQRFRVLGSGVLGSRFRVSRLRVKRRFQVSGPAEFVHDIYQS